MTGGGESLRPGVLKQLQLLLRDREGPHTSSIPSEHLRQEATTRHRKISVQNQAKASSSF